MIKFLYPCPIIVIKHIMIIFVARLYLQGGIEMYLQFPNCRFRTGTLTELTVCSLGSLLHCLGQYLERLETM